MSKLLYSKYTIYISVFVIVITEILQQLFDYLYGDSNGQIFRYNISTIISIIHFGLGIVIILNITNISNLLLKNIGNTLILLFIIEIILLIFIPHRSDVPFKSYGTINNNYRQLDSTLGYIPLANTKVNSVRLTLDNDTIYHVNYTTDSLSKRFTPVVNDSTSKHAIFFGCSFTFGEGVNDDETLPFYYQIQNPSYRSYNYGFNGYGPQQMLANLTDVEIKKNIKENDGIAFYLYIPDHIRRSAGAMTFYMSYGYHHPYYYLDSDENLIRKKSFKEGRSSLINSTLNFLYRIRLLQFFNIEIYPPGNQYKLTAEIMNMSYKKYTENFNNTDFYIILYDNSYFSYIKPFLNENIKVLDYTFIPKERLHDVDGHPNNNTYMNIAKKLTNDLNKKD